MSAPSFFRRLVATAILLGSAFAWSTTHAAPPNELAPGLAYLRIPSLPKSAGELDNALQHSKALVLDLRYVANEPDAAAILNRVNGQLTQTRVYVLVSPDTPRAVADALAQTTTSRLVLLGIKDSRPTPQVIIEQSAKDDRQAYEAAAAGTPISELISGKIEKERFDEASLVAEFKNGNHDAQPPSARPSTSSNSETAAPKAQAKLTDRVLQRAVNLHRALEVLKKG